MRAKLTDVWFVAGTALLCLLVLALEAHLAVDEEVLFRTVVTVLLWLLTLVVRTAVALVRHPNRRLWAPWGLIAGTVLLLFLWPPSEARLALSKNSLEDYASTAKSTNLCAEGPSHDRWVGLYRINCADNHNGTVNLRVDEPLIPSSGAPWLVESDDWEVWLQD